MIAGLLSRLVPMRKTAPRNVAVAPTGRTLSLDNPADWADLIENTESAAGITVTHSRALTLAPVWQAVSMISGDVASMTLNVFLRDDDDSRHIDKDHPAEPIVSQVANEDTPAYEFWRRTMAHALLWGNGYAWIERASPRRGAPTALYNLLPDRTTPRWDRATQQLYYLTEVDGKLWPLFKEEVLHVKGLSVDVGVGADLVAAARDAFGLGLALQGFSSKFFAQGAQAAGVLEVPPHLSPEAVHKLAEGWQKQISGSDNWFKVAILREGVKFHATTISPENAQSHEMREDSRRDVASFFNLPPFKLGIADSVSYNSAEQAQLAYLTSTLNHWRMAISSECDLKLLDREDVLTGQRYFEHNVSNLIEIDIATLTDVLAKQLEVELISPNEGRRKLNLPPRTDPGGDEYANPNTKSQPRPVAQARTPAGGEIQVAGEGKSAARIRAFDEDKIERDDRGQFAPSEGGGDGAPDRAVQEQREQQDADRADERQQEETDFSDRIGDEDEAISEAREKEDEKVEAAREKEDAQIETVREKEDAVTEKLREKEDTQTEKTREKEDKASEKEEAAIEKEREQLDSAREKEDAVTEKLREKIEAQDEKAREKEDAQIDKAREKDPDDQATRDRHEAEDKATQERREAEDVAVGEQWLKEDADREAAREAEDEALQARENAIDPEAVEQDREEQDAEREAAREQEDIDRADAREAADNELADRRADEDSDREAARDKADEELQAARDKEWAAIEERRRREDEAEATRRKREDQQRNPSRQNAAPGRLTTSLRPLLAEASGRLARRLSHDLRTLAKKPAKFLAWLDSGGFDHRELVAEALGGIGAAVAVARGLDDLATAGLQATLAAAFLDDLHGQLSPLVEPPHSSADLTTNVDKACGAWETSIAARLEQLAFGE